MRAAFLLPVHKDAIKLSDQLLYLWLAVIPGSFQGFDDDVYLFATIKVDACKGLSHAIYLSFRGM